MSFRPHNKKEVWMNWMKWTISFSLACISGVLGKGGGWWGVFSTGLGTSSPGHFWEGFSQGRCHSFDSVYQQPQHEMQKLDRRSTSVTDSTELNCGLTAGCRFKTKNLSQKGVPEVGSLPIICSHSRTQSPLRLQHM